MRRNLTAYLSQMMLREADGLGSGAVDTSAVTPDAGTVTTPESILFPSETPSAPAGDDTTSEKGQVGEGSANGDKSAEDAGKKEGEASGDEKPEWKPYENDPNKTDEENAAAKAEHDKGDPASPLNQVPADGKYTLEMPEGIELDTVLLDALGPEFKELGLTNGQAQKLADKFIEAEQAKAKTRSEDWAKTVTKWSEDAKTDKEIGGSNWNATVKSASRAINEFGTPELKTYLDATGGGNHPELIRLMSKVGNLISEDAPPQDGGGGDGKKADPAHVLFPNDIPKG